jgi:hypothetical protein
VSEDHPEEPVELRALHALPVDEDVASEELLALGKAHVEVAAKLP